MKIVFLCPDLRRGGAERQWSVLLPALQQRGLDVSVVTIAGGGHFADTLVRDGVPVIIPYFSFDGLEVWGATAMVLAELASVLTDVGLAAS